MLQGNDNGQNKGWKVQIDTVHSCGKAPDSITVRISALAAEKIKILMSHFKNTEWLAYLVGESGENYIRDIAIPKQRVNGTHVGNVLLEEDEIPIAGVIHSHHDMGNFFSGTDDEYVNQNHNISLVATNKKITGQVRWKTPCGALMDVEANVKHEKQKIVDEDAFLKEVEQKVTVKKDIRTAGRMAQDKQNGPGFARYGDRLKQDRFIAKDAFPEHASPRPHPRQVSLPGTVHDKNPKSSSISVANCPDCGAKSVRVASGRFRCDNSLTGKCDFDTPINPEDSDITVTLDDIDAIAESSFGVSDRIVQMEQPMLIVRNPEAEENKLCLTDADEVDPDMVVSDANSPEPGWNVDIDQEEDETPEDMVAVDAPCPICGDVVRYTEKVDPAEASYECDNQACNFEVPGEVMYQEVTLEDVESLILTGRTKAIVSAPDGNIELELDMTADPETPIVSEVIVSLEDKDDVEDTEGTGVDTESTPRTKKHGLAASGPGWTTKMSLH